MAMAPEQTGIGIRRHFTTEGVDPYEEVVWERREAKITNYRDGAVAFEQADVEFPVGWSQNATNIVAQKYFRGQLSSPERESSLRQVIDRVVDTVTGWGTKDGYFVDDQEAEAFRAELKHLILHQKAAFNSPVWFNIGVKGEPQQASACQPYDALVSTPAGLIPIGKLVNDAAIGTKVYDAHGLTRIEAVKANGRKAVLRIHTKAGQALDVTADHLVWRASGYRCGRFVPAGELRPGDKLSWHRTGSFGDAEMTPSPIAEDVPGTAGELKLLEIDRIEERGEMDVYDIQTESGEYLSGNLRVHNCFILSVNDTMRSILNWYVEEGTIFKGGSGSGINLSTIRSSYEPLKGGGTASGPVSFMRGADASAGTIKSAGKTRRAAKMVILNSDHPDVEDFIWCKAIEERKARVLRDAGFDMDLDGRDSHSTQYQNANNSVRVTDEFMQAVVDDADWDLKAVSTGETVRTLKARELFRQIAEATWECADPGMQYDTTINRWHTASNTGRINASNPCCFTGETLIDTEYGPMRFDLLCKEFDAGNPLPRVWSLDSASGERQLRRPTSVWKAGDASTLVQVRTENGQFLRCTPEHRFLTSDGEFMPAESLTGGSELRTLGAADLVAKVEGETPDVPVAVYDMEVEETHTFAVTGEGGCDGDAIVVHNSEYMHLDNSACNLASLNLLRFLDDDGTFDVEGFTSAASVVFTAQEILVGNADYPTASIAETSRRFRQLGLGYANLGAMLMAKGMPYDSDQGRAWAAAITALMTGAAYATSARTAGRMGPFAGYNENREPMGRVLRMHRDEVARINEELVQVDLLTAAQESWDEAVELSDTYGVRNSQATVLAPTGCLVGGSLVATDRGLVRLRSLGDPGGEQWQDLDVAVATDEGPCHATRFYVNGLEPVVTVGTARGHRIQGTPQHRVRVVDETTGAWEWRRFSDLRDGDLVPMSLDQLVGTPRVVSLPPLADDAHPGDDLVAVPEEMTPDLAELAGYFLAAGSVSADGLCLVADVDDFDVVERLERLGKATFGLAAQVAVRNGAVEVAFRSARLARWWEASGLAVGDLPDTVLATNDRWAYSAFLRGAFESAGTVAEGVPQWTTTAPGLAHDVHALLLALGYPATLTVDDAAGPTATLSLLDGWSVGRWLEEVGFVSGRKHAAVVAGHDRGAAVHDVIPVLAELVESLLPERGRLRKTVLAELAEGGVSRATLTRLYQRTADAELGRILSFSYDRVCSAELGAEELTYDLSVPENVTYVANGFVSHNTIGLMMDCDTTGIEPDLGLCKTKKLVGGGTMSIVNQTVPRALRRMGYSPEQVIEIVAYIDEHKSIVGAPHLSADHLEVFACSMGDNVIHYLGHVKMMAAVQPWISGAISKCVVGETLISTADGLMRIGSLHQGEEPDTFREHRLVVASIDGAQKAEAFYYGGVREVRQAVLRSGHRVTATPNHRLLVAADGRLDWRRMDELEVGDRVAVQYGADLWSVLPVQFDDFTPSPSYGCQKSVTVPTEMTEELAFLLGAYASEGHTSRSTWSITVTNSVDSVLERVAAVWRSEFGIEARIVRPSNRCPAVVASSKTAVEFLEHLGCGARASAKRIPDAVLQSPREMVLAFLQGLALDAYVSVASMPKWGICVDSPALLDDLQAVLTNLGVVHGRISKRNRTNGKTYDEVYATGRHAKRMVALVPFVEPDKAGRALDLVARTIAANHDTAELVPGISTYELYRLLPAGTRTPFAYLCDPRTRYVSRGSIERVAAVPGVVLPPWLQTVLDDGLHFSPVESVVVAEDQEVFDLAVPATQAFVGNGIVNHNTINMPESVSVEEVEQLHIDAWRMGLKAVAIYRDNCKVAQPLSATKTDKALAAAASAAANAASAAVASVLAEPADRLVETVVIREPVRAKLPRKRNSKTMSFRVADCHGYVTVGQYDDGRPGEIFLKVAKQGSTLAGIMDAFAISVSHGLQYGVPLKAFVDMYTNMRFEPAGMTDDPDLRFASSLVDYIFRRLAVEYLPFEERAELGILTVDERMQPTLPGVEEFAVPTSTGSELVPDPPAAVAKPAPAPAPAPAQVELSTPQPVASDAPYCYQCGMVMQRAGACFVCSSCGTTSGCS